MTKKKKRLSVSEFLSFLRAGLIEERHTRADVFFKKWRFYYSIKLYTEVIVEASVLPR